MSKGKLDMEEIHRESKSKVMTILLCITLFCVFSIFLLMILNKGEIVFNNREDTNSNEPASVEEPKDENVETSRLEIIELNEENKELQINGILVKIKYVDNNTYINDILYEELYSTSVIVMDKYAILLNNCQCGYCINKYIDENGEVKSINNTLSDSTERQFNEFKLVDGGIEATAEVCPCLDGCESSYEVKFVYDNKELSINKK